MLRVSVIIPTYNRANYLIQALQSIFDQSLAPDEIIVVDDGSTDNTAEVMSALGTKVRYCRQEHRGVSAARNLGLDMAQGDVIAWLDADDLWEPDFLSTLIPFLDRHPELDGAYCGLRHMDATGKLLPASSTRTVPPQDLFSALHESDFIVTPSIVMKKRCFDQVGYFDLHFDICEDYDMWLRLARTCMIAGVPQPLVRIRVHPHSAMMRDIEAFCHFRVALIQKHFGALDNTEPWSEDKQRAYAYAFFTCALKYIENSRIEQGWPYFEKALTIWPDLLNRLDVFFELACGNQPRGYRGQADLLDIEGNEAQMLRRLDAVFAKGGSALQPLRGQAYGNAYIALGILYDQAGQWAAARRCLVQAIKSNPRLLGAYPIVRRLVKLCSGQRLVRLGRALRGTQSR